MVYVKILQRFKVELFNYSVRRSHLTKWICTTYNVTHIIIWNKFRFSKLRTEAFIKRSH